MGCSIFPDVSDEAKEPVELPDPEDDQKEQETLAAGAYEAEDVFADAEPWVPAETKMVVWSFIAAAISLAIFGTLINIYLL